VQGTLPGTPSQAQLQAQQNSLFQKLAQAAANNPGLQQVVSPNPKALMRNPSCCQKRSRLPATRTAAGFEYPLFTP
jgi:hypothetical protein